MEKSEYDIQAEEFLKKTGTEMTVEFLRFGQMDWDKKTNQNRNVFKITIKNACGEYSTDFGASLNDSLTNCKDIIYEKEIEFKLTLKYESLKHPFLSFNLKINIDKLSELMEENKHRLLLRKKDLEKNYHEFIKSNTTANSRVVNVISLYDYIDHVTARFNRFCNDLKYKNFGKGIQKTEIEKPRAYDFLAALTKYDPGTFEDFCSNYGYDEDSRTAERIYNSVVKEWKCLRKMYNDDELTMLEEIQ